MNPSQPFILRPVATTLLMVAIMLSGLGAIAWMQGDTLVLQLCLMGVAALLGFMVLNYPFGKLFMGDGGAYLSGFWLAACAVVVTVDPWALLQPGFWLSFVAVGVLFASDPGTAPAAAGWRGRALALLREQLVVTVALAPLTLLLFGQVSLVGLLANLVAIPWVTLVVTPLAMLGVLVPLSWDLAALAVGLLGACLQVLAAWPLAVWSGAAPALWAGACGVAFLPIAIYLTAGSATIANGWIVGISGFVPLYLFFLVVEIPHALFLARYRETIAAEDRSLLLASVAVLLALPTYFFGPFNDLSMRGSIGPIAVLAFCFARAMTRFDRLAHPLGWAVGVAIVAIGAFGPAVELRRALAAVIALSLGGAPIGGLRAELVLPAVP